MQIYIYFMQWKWSFQFQVGWSRTNLVKKLEENPNGVTLVLRRLPGFLKRKESRTKSEVLKAHPFIHIYFALKYLLTNIHTYINTYIHTYIKILILNWQVRSLINHNHWICDKKNDRKWNYEIKKSLSYTSHFLCQNYEISYFCYNLKLSLIIRNLY